MDVARIREGIRKMRFSAIWDRWESGEIGQDAAAELLGMSVRSFHRWKDRYEAEGEAGLVDQRGGPSPRRAPGGSRADARALPGQVRRLHRQAFPRAVDQAARIHARLHGNEDFPAPRRAGQARAQALGAPQEAAAAAGARHDASSGRIKACVGRGPAGDGPDRHHGRRHERDLLDGPRRRRGDRLDLRGLARGDRRAWPVLRALHRPRQPLLPYPGGRRQSLEHGPDAGRPGLGASGDRAHRRLFAAGARTLRAAVRHPAGPFPQGVAAGRDHNRRGDQRLAESHYIAGHNARFAVDPEQEGSAFVPDAHEMWREILCVVEERTVANDNTVAWNGKRLQLPESRLRPHFVKAQVRVHEYPDATCAVFLGPHRLADYDAAGTLRVPTAPKSGVVLGAVKDKPCRARSRASLTAPPRDASSAAQAGTRKRPPSRTRKQPDPNTAIGAA